MLKHEYFLKAVNNDAALERDWVITCFSPTDYEVYEENDEDHFYPYQLVYSRYNRGTLYFVDPDSENGITELEPHPIGKPYMNYADRIKLSVGSLANVDRELETRYGNVIANAILFIYPFGNRISFMTGKIDGDKIASMIADKLRDTPKEGEEREKGFFYVDELEKHANAATYLEAFNYTCVPTTSEKTMLPNPAVIKLRDELLKKHAHELDNPAVIADIQAQMVALDKESFKDDRAAGFYLSGKSYNVSRMKKFGMMGLIGGIGDVKPSLVGSSLAEGWDKEKINSYVDDIRAGSYSRGKSTAISGYGVKLVYNAFQSVRVVEDDCGVTKGLAFKVTKSNYGRFINRYLLDSKNNPVLITEEIARNAIGSVINVRTPMLCKTTPPSFCAKCVGMSIARLPNSVHITASDINSIYMNITMKSMHGKSLSTAIYTIVNDNK